MKRVENWERALDEALEVHRKAAPIWGKSDCWCMALDCVKAVTGKDPWAGVRTYKTEAGAAKVLRKRGFETIEDALAAKFERVPILMAKRGDIGVYEGSAGVFTGAGFAVRSLDGISMVPVTAVKTAFRVG
jgi:hypothetical protein